MIYEETEEELRYAKLQLRTQSNQSKLLWLSWDKEDEAIAIYFPQNIQPTK